MGVVEMSKGRRWEAVLMVFDWVIMVSLNWINAWCEMAVVECVVGVGWRVKD